MAEKNLFRQRIVGLLGGTQAAAAEHLSVAQHSVSQWVAQQPRGAIGDVLEAALDTLDDDQLRTALTLALEKRSAAART